MQTVPHVLGVAHPTGYPTYILLAWAFELLPIGSVAFRGNLLSGILVAGTLAVTVAILMRLRVRPLIAFGTALALGAVGTVWSAATVAEVNPLHLFLMAAADPARAALGGRPTPAGPAPGRARDRPRDRQPPADPVRGAVPRDLRDLVRSVRRSASASGSCLRRPV